MGAMVASAMPAVVILTMEGIVELFSEAGSFSAFSERWGCHDHHQSRHKGCYRQHHHYAPHKRYLPYVVRPLLTGFA